MLRAECAGKILKQETLSIFNDSMNRLLEQHIPSIPQNRFMALSESILQNYMKFDEHLLQNPQDFLTGSSQKVQLSFHKQGSYGCEDLLVNAALLCVNCEGYHNCPYCVECAQFEFGGFVKCLVCDEQQEFNQSDKMCRKCKTQLYSYCCLECGIACSNYDVFHSQQLGVCVLGIECQQQFCEKCGQHYSALLFADHECKTLADHGSCQVCMSDFDHFLHQPVRLGCKQVKTQTYHYVCRYCVPL